MERLSRFDAVMAHALHLADTPEGWATPLAQAERDLVGLAEQERRDPPTAGCSPDDMEACRFAIYAWVDEKLLCSARSDAVQWASCSLQQRYFGSTAAGTEFYERLCGHLEAFRAVLAENEPAVGSLPDSALPALLLRYGDGPGPAVPGAALRLQGAEPPSHEVLRAYALCLVYGFRGKLFRSEHEPLLREFREAGYRLLQPGLPAQLPPVLEQARSDGKARGSASNARGVAEREGWRGVLRLVEPYALMLAPLAVCAALYVYCAGVLASLTLPSGP